MGNFAYYDLRQERASQDIVLLFPGWQGTAERVLVFSPHDDDALLGAGYLMAAVRAQGAQVYVCVFCDGSAGYSRVADRETIVAQRRAETAAAYGRCGIPAERVIPLGYPDFSLVSYVGWKLAGGGRGTLGEVLPLLRRLGITRLLIPNGYREHSDHEAAFDIARYDGVQAGDPVLVDVGTPCPVVSTLQYAVWSDLDPEDALVAGADPHIRANRAIVAPYEVEQEIAQALGEWKSQGAIIDGLLAQRRARDMGAGMIEVYLALDPRPKLEYGPYRELVKSIG